MVDWLKFIGGSFFVNKYAMQGAERRVWNAVIAFLVGWVLIYAGLTVGYSCSFSTHYYNCSAITQTVESVFDSGLMLKTSGNKAISGMNGEWDNGFVINTFASDSDFAEYSHEGGNVILDTRPLISTYAQFTVSYTDKNGNSIMRDMYKSLSPAARENYEVKVEISHKAIELTDALIEKCINYLDGACKETSQDYNADIAARYNDLLDHRAETDKTDFQNEIYELCVGAYYPEISGLDKYAAVPSVRTWYDKNIFSNKSIDNYIAILDDTVIGKFVTYGGIPVSFNGYYFKTDGMTAHDGSSAKAFIVRSFDGAKALNMNIYLINLLKITPLLLLVPLFLGLVLRIADKAMKLDIFGGTGGAIKAVFSFVLIGSVITFLITILLSYLLPRGAVYSLVLLVYAITVTVRTVALALPRFISAKRQKSREIENSEI